MNALFASALDCFSKTKLTNAELVERAIHEYTHRSRRIYSATYRVTAEILYILEVHLDIV